MIDIKTVNKAYVYYVELDSKDSLAEKVDLSNKLFFSQKNDGGKYKAVLIEQPFMPTKYKVIYADNKFHEEGRRLAEEGTKYRRATASVIVKNDRIITSAFSGNDHHEKYGCERKKQGIVSGNYEACPGCHPDVHSEAKAIKKAKDSGNYDDLKDATNYLYNHWWVCKDCNEKMEKAGIKLVVLPKKWVQEFLEIKDNFL